jgi:hypothetical protein
MGGAIYIYVVCKTKERLRYAITSKYNSNQFTPIIFTHAPSSTPFPTALALFPFLAFLATDIYRHDINYVCQNEVDAY